MNKNSFENVRPLVSIIIPCFNHGRYLGDALRSVCGQTYQPIEMIVVDDGSTDHTAEMTRSFGPKVRYLRQEHQGSSRARNLGIAASQGSFIGFLDADDGFYPTKIERQVLELVQDPALDLVYCGWKTVREDSASVLEVGRTSQDRHLADELLTHSVFHVLCALFRRKVVDTTGFFDENLATCEDRDFWLRAVKSGHRFGCLDKPLCWIRDLSDGLHTHYEWMYRDSLSILEKHSDLMSDERIFRGKRGRLHLRAASQYLRHRNCSGASACLQRALSDKPNILESCTTLESAAIAIAGDPYQHKVNLAQAHVALDELVALAKPFVSRAQVRKHTFFVRMTLARLAAQAWEFKASRQAYLHALKIALTARVPLSRVQEVLRGVLGGVLRRRKESLGL